MIHVLKIAERPDQNIIESFRKLAVATIYEASGKKGFIDCAIKPLAKGMRICGPAFTVQCVPGDNLMLHKALQTAKAGDVLVASMGDGYFYGYLGSLMGTAAITAKLGGLAIDGCVRDTEELIEMDFPVFCRGACIRGTAKNGLGTINYPLNFGGATIYPGDLIMGDDDGMVVVRRQDLADVLQKSLDRVANEKKKSEQLQRGISSMELNKLEDVCIALGMKEEE
ncbi:MAG TPA: 4-carboxy-4-hydroxy-2-oxoadipate aldolase/oxaloacetate decarboxylase [Rectinema sp.]|jgi:4-hydroxy-4-methyl-2-oxoglutarate aldolase|nr:4-carboxy-4-hydroxy-2-oxoadipate aldolase/oxaloacetate decarboxylase [Spirochaetia bacterium]MDI9426702.1 4-carboxy-4-hydroxy-2-oxoadipate aldolase/oxaloacetate decarboxylase [Spirochaetota bacterium]NLH89610.1 4-carboxy-4-hydroxy-2-oxoadipate aldolase/oxaloacetate decarboxylase [Treponema sp.]OQC74166.1 MAG: 4-hydroxy-4-methyl-2-oxoglutarate aldolase [Spirochaetes bacterium ADurb.Bin001]HNP93300.1 4-carboxy-4-hydroxy-2-oxoadipate aldolase/oxaloacetate decarboxylase [Rectinema sp.]